MNLRRQLGQIFQQAAQADPSKGWRHAIGENEMTPIQSMGARSHVFETFRQLAPPQVGGYSKAERKALDNFLLERPGQAETVLRIGRYPELPGGAQYAQGRGQEAMRRTAQLSGALLGDISTQGAQNVWWFINAVEAASMLAAQQGLHGVLGGREKIGPIPLGPLSRKRIEGAPAGIPLHGRRMVWASVPMAIAAGAAAGTVFRQPGFKAVVPSDEDPRETADPISEAVLRFIGRKGELLKYDDFVKERPDVSPGEYEAYKAYLYGSNMPFKAAMEGIHGPEVNFLGKSVPLLTGVLPIVGGIIGARKGLRMAGRRVAGVDRQLQPIPGRSNHFFKESLLEQQVSKARDHRYQVNADPKSTPDARMGAQQDFNRAEARYTRKREQVGNILAQGALLGGIAGLGVTGAGAALLEQVRRGNIQLGGEPEQAV